jgi:hypothetical protein
MSKYKFLLFLDAVLKKLEPKKKVEGRGKSFKLTKSGISSISTLEGQKKMLEVASKINSRNLR